MTADIHHHKILILDFGSQYAQLIARRVREIGVYCELFSPLVDAEKIKAFKPNGIILSGGPETVTSHQTPRAQQVVFELGCPVLGICYGMQTMALQLGGAVESSVQSEFGFARCELQNQDALVAESLEVWMSHGDKVTEVPPGFTITLASTNCAIAAMSDSQKQFYGVQFHPEVTHTKNGKLILERFVKDVCQCETNWKTSQIQEALIDKVQQQVGDEKVLLALSGGVDSSVVAALLHQAIGKQLTCVFVDTGLLRKNEGDQVMQTFADHMELNVIRINAGDRFFNALKGVVDPEAKRKIAGELFITIFNETAAQFKGFRFLAQGTIYPDVIESAAASQGTAHVIKSHHNVGGLPKDMSFELVEPLRELFKDEVRELGLQLGLPHHMVFRHPFPGPGFAVRILEEVTEPYVAILREADAIFIECLRQFDWYEKTSQAFAVFLPVKSVGVKGDARCYEYVIALRAVNTTDFMTAEWSALPHEFLMHVSGRILNEVPQVARVVYDISSKPPATIEWE